MKAREIILAIFIIMAGLLLTSYKTGKIPLRWDGGDIGFFGWDNEEFLFEETQEIPGAAPVLLEVRNSRGDVVVEAAEAGAPTVKVVFRKRIYRKNQAAADAVAAKLKMTVARPGDRLILSTNREQIDAPRCLTEFKILVPSGTPVVAITSYGTLRATGMGRTELRNAHGRVSAAAIAGDLLVNTNYEAVDVDGVQGDCRIEALHGEVQARNVQGDLAIENSYERVRVDYASKKLSIVGKSSDILAKNILGGVEIRSSREPVKVAGAASVKIENRNGDVEVVDIRGPAAVFGEHGRVRAEAVTGSLQVEGRDVGLTARNVSGGDITVNTSYQDVEILDFSGKARLSVDHGDLHLRPRDVVSPVEVRGEYCAVDLEWPADVRAPFHGLTRSGEIHWGLSEKPALEKTDGTSETMAFGWFVAGRPGVKITTSYGNIRVREAVAASPDR